MFLKNLTLKTKFLIMILVTVILVAFMGIFSTEGMYKSKSVIENELDKNKQTIANSMGAIEDIIQLRFVTFRVNKNIEDDYTMNQFEDSKKIVEEAYLKAKHPLQDALTKLDPSKDAQLINLVNQCIVKTDEFYNAFILFLDYLEKGNTVEAQKQEQIAAQLGNEMFETAYQLPNVNFDEMIFNLGDVLKNMQSKTIMLASLTILCILFSIVFGVSLANSIRKPIEKIKQAAQKVLKGDLNIDIRTNDRNELGELSNTIANMSGTIQCIIDDINTLSEKLEEGDTSYRINTNKYSGAFKDATYAINLATNGLVEDALYVAKTIKEIEQGNFNSHIKELAGDKAVSTNALKNIQLTLKDVSNEIHGLINAAIEGDLSYHLDSSKYNGEWKATIDGLETFGEIIAMPIRDMQEAFMSFSKGNFTFRITNQYKGDFDEIKQTVNYTAETIGSYISEISQILYDMAHKNFDVSIDRQYLGDFKAIQESVNLIVKNLNILTKDIISSAQQVSAGSKQISESSVSLAEGAAQQAESVDKLNQIIRVISEQTRENAENSNKANLLAIETKENASKGSEQMNNMLIAMEAINTASSSISNIIKVIDDIAFQTNILALNAAVEAARAGEHGKGFAVVAEEVRSLAGRSQQAARETTELIESSVSKVEEGSKMANQTSEALLSIVKQIEDISGLIEACAKSSNEQQISITQVIEGIDQISNVTQVNTATSEESAAASEELASQAQVFYASVSDFKLKEDKTSGFLNSPIKPEKLDKPKNKKPQVSKPALNKNNDNITNIDLSSNDMIILDDSEDIIINESLDFGKY